MKTISEARKLSEVEQTVADFLVAQSITYIAHAAGKGLMRDEWECDGWRCVFKRGDKEEHFNYFTGTGHRALSKRDYNEVMREHNTVYRRRLIAQYARPVKPCAASVLYSIIWDSIANNESFDDWCAGYGYDNDSMRSFRIYQECCDNAKRLRRVFTREQIEHLS